MNIKPPYTVAAIASKNAAHDDLYLVRAVDTLMRDLRMHELATQMDAKKRNAILQKHVDAAFEYYSHFTKADLAKMLIAESLLMEGGDGCEK